MPNRWLGYSERGLMAAWFQDLHALDASAAPVLAQLLCDAGLEEGTFKQAIESADSLLTILEPGFAGFGDPDGIIVFIRGGEAIAWLQVEAKRGPLVTEWTPAVTARGNEWNSSHLVVQVARRVAFWSRRENTAQPAPIEFFSRADYWRNPTGSASRSREMKLEKSLVLEWLSARLPPLGRPSAVLTLTASRWDPPRSMLTAGDHVLDDILGTWNIPRRRPPIVHLGLDDIVSRRSTFPTLEDTFRFNLLDTVVQGTQLEKDKAWDLWETRCGSGPLDRLRQTAPIKDLVLGHRGKYELYNDGTSGKAAVKLMPCYGPGGPTLCKSSTALILELRHHADRTASPGIPAGWKSWSEQWGEPHRERKLGTTRWISQLLVPD
jgi:hypothetical protein